MVYQSFHYYTEYKESQLSQKNFTKINKLLVPYKNKINVQQIR